MTVRRAMGKRAAQRRRRKRAPTRAEQARQWERDRTLRGMIHSLTPRQRAQGRKIPRDPVKRAARLAMDTLRAALRLPREFVKYRR